jgi:hypothetical protein
MTVETATKAGRSSRRRRLPSPTEQARRKAWGAEYAAKVKNATKDIREDGK